MQKLMIGAAALALLAGCNQQDKPAPGIDEPLKEVTVRAGNAANAADALAAMSLSESGSGILAFADKTVDGANATFTDVTFAGDETVKVGSLVFEGLDNTDAGTDFGKMSLNDVVIAPEGEDGEVKLGTLEVVNPSPALSAWLAGVLDDGQPDAEFPAVGELSFDSIAMKGLSGAFDDSDAQGTFGIGSFEINGMSDLKAARAVLSDVSLDVLNLEDDMPVKVTLGSMSASNIDAKFVKAIQENMGDEEELMAALMSTVYDNPMDPGYDRVTMDSLSAAVGGATFEIPSLDAFVERNDAGQPVKYVTEPYTMSLTADPEGGEVGAALLEGLSVVGYESVELKGAGVATYDPDKDIVSFAAGDNYLELTDGAKFSFGGKIEGYNAYSKQVGQSFNVADLAAGEEPDPMAMMSALGELTFHGLEFSIDDDTLVNRVLNAVATQSGQDPEQLRNQASMMLGMAPMMVQGSGFDVALVTEATSALSTFVSEPGTITFKLDPAEPLSVATLMANPDPAALTKDTLGFSAEAK